ncbi:MAG: glycosyltransferase [Gemmatimonadales bacterium]
MRLVYCTDVAAGWLDPVDRLLRRALGALAGRGATVAVIAPRAGAGAEPGPDQPALALPSLALWARPEIRLARPAFARVVALLERVRPDVVHCASELTVGWMGLFAARRLGIPVVSTYRRAAGRLRALGDGLGRYLTVFHRQSDSTVALSAAAQGELARLGIRGVIPFDGGVELDRFHPARRSSELRRALGVERRFVFLYLPGPAPDRWLGTAVLAHRLVVERLGADSSSLLMPLWGDSGAPAPGALTAVPVDGGGGPRDWPTLAASADACVIGGGLETAAPMLEAMASGLPVIAPASGVLADQLGVGVNGLAYRDGDARHLAYQMEELLLCRGLRGRLTRGARAWAESRDAGHALDRLAGLYRELAAGRNRRPRGVSALTLVVVVSARRTIGGQAELVVPDLPALERRPGHQSRAAQEHQQQQGGAREPEHRLPDGAGADHHRHHGGRHRGQGRLLAGFLVVVDHPPVGPGELFHHFLGLFAGMLDQERPGAEQHGEGGGSGHQLPGPATHPDRQQQRDQRQPDDREMVDHHVQVGPVRHHGLRGDG